METGHPIEGSFGNEFSSIGNYCGIMAAWSCKTWKKRPTPTFSEIFVKKSLPVFEILNFENFHKITLIIRGDSGGGWLVDSQPKLVESVWGSRPATWLSVCIHQMHRLAIVIINDCHEVNKSSPCQSISPLVASKFDISGWRYRVTTCRQYYHTVFKIKKHPLLFCKTLLNRFKWLVRI